MARKQKRKDWHAYQILLPPELRERLEQKAASKYCPFIDNLAGYSRISGRGGREWIQSG